MPRLVASAKYRSDNLSKLGKLCTKQLHKLVDDPTIEKFAKVKNSTDYKALNKTI